MNQPDKVLKYLKKHNSITAMQSWRKLGVYRLSDAVLKLRKRGYAILTVMVKRKDYQFAKYLVG